VVAEADEGGYHAYCPALRHLGAVTQGVTEDEAFRNIDEVIHMIVDELREEGAPLQGGLPDEVELWQDTRVAVTI
jgi:predicted RNase H-like HicB family nuclease